MQKGKHAKVSVDSWEVARRGVGRYIQDLAEVSADGTKPSAMLRHSEEHVFGPRDMIKSNGETSGVSISMGPTGLIRGVLGLTEECRRLWPEAPSRRRLEEIQL